MILYLNAIKKKVRLSQHEEDCLFYAKDLPRPAEIGKEILYALFLYPFTEPSKTPLTKNL